MNSIGRVVSVTFEKLIFEVSDFNKLNFNSNGFTYIAQGVIDYVTIIDNNKKKYIYQVVKIEDKELPIVNDENSKLDYLGRFECTPIGILKNDKIEFNMESYPFLQNEVFLTTKEEFEIMFQIKNAEHFINLGLVEDKYSIKIDISKLYNHHSAILGNTGSGKSTTIRQIIAETKMQPSSNLYLHVFDVHSEYNQRDENTTNIIDVLDEYKVSLECLDLQDWINLVKPSDLVQLPVLQMALKLANVLNTNLISEIWLRCFLAYTLYNNVQTDAVAKRTKIINVLQGTDIDTSRYNAQYANFQGLAEMQFLDSLIEKMHGQHANQSDYSFLQSQIEKCDYKTNSFEFLLKGLDYTFLLEECKGNTQARAHCGTLETRIKSIQTRYSSLLTSDQDIDNTKLKQVNIYSVFNLDDDLLLFFTTYLMKSIFEKNKNKKLSDRDLHVFILEEAHRYISKTKENSSFQEIEFFKKIAREGRKFGCFLFLSSQRPSELSSTVLSQCNNYIIHRIKNNLDLDYMLKTIPYIDKNQLTRISYLPTGVAFLVGELFPIPIEMSIYDSLNIQVSTTPNIKYDL